MKRKLITFMVVLLTLALTNTVLTSTVGAAVKTNTAASTYNGNLKTKNNKYGIEITNKDGSK